jgi:hypothetical protein
MVFNSQSCRLPRHVHTCDQNPQHGVQVAYDTGAGGWLPHATIRLEAWSTSELEQFLQLMHQQMNMVRPPWGCCTAAAAAASRWLLHSPAASGFGQ